jgi:hypothetical protein
MRRAPFGLGRWDWSLILAVAVLAIFALALSCARPARAAEISPAGLCGMNGAETAVAAVDGGLLWVDWKQTREAQERRFSEGNAVLGPHPSNQAIDAYFAEKLLVWATVICISRDRWRWLTLGIGFGAEYDSVAANWSFGFHAGF